MGVHFDEAQMVPGVFTGDEPLQSQSHLLYIDVLPLVTHASAHIHNNGGRTFRGISSLVYNNIVTLDT